MDEKINKFISSISWRILISLLNKDLLNDKEREIYIDAEKKIRDYLMGKRGNPYNNYLFFFNEKLRYKEPTRDYLWYIERANDMYVTISKELAFVYFNFPKMFFVTQIRPINYSFGGKRLFGDMEVGFAVDAKSNLITENGKIPREDLIFLPQTEDFFLERAKGISTPINKNQVKRIAEMMEKNKGKILGSESYKAYIKSKGFGYK